MFVRRALFGRPAITVALAACGASPGASPSQGAAPLDAETAAIGAAMAQMRGHLRVATESRPRGATLTAPRCTPGHPAAELLDVVRGDLEEAGADVDALATDLPGRERRRRRGWRRPMRSTRPSRRSRPPRRQFAGDLADDPAYIGSVIASLLNDRRTRVRGGGHRRRARQPRRVPGRLRLHARGASPLRHHRGRGRVCRRRGGGGDRGRVRGACQRAAEPPRSRRPWPPLEDVVAAAALIGHEPEETVGALAVTESDPPRRGRRDQPASGRDPGPGRGG